MVFGSERVRRPVVIGFGATLIGRHPERTPDELGLEALSEALEVANLRPHEIQGLYLDPQGYTRAQPPIRPQRVAEKLGIATRALIEVECGGTSGLLAFKSACEDVAVGHLDVAAVIGAQCERRAFSEGMDAGDLDRVFLLNAMYGSWLGPYGVVAALPLYALCAQRYMHEHDIEPAAVAELPVRLRRNAALNRRAEQRQPITVEDVLGSRMVSPPIHKLEAAPWSDGGAAVIVASQEFARQRQLPGATLTGWGECHDDANYIPFGKSLTQYPWIRAATDHALARSNRTRSDLDVLEIYGAFAASEYMTYEAMGLFEPGKSAPAVAAGATAIDGALPINTSGGRIAMGHPPQATPLLEVGEIFDQLLDRAGERQVAGAAIGLVQAEHGMMNGAAVAILEAF